MNLIATSVFIFRHDELDIENGQLCSCSARLRLPLPIRLTISGGIAIDQPREHNQASLRRDIGRVLHV